MLQARFTRTLLPLLLCHGAALAADGGMEIVIEPEVVIEAAPAAAGDEILIEPAPTGDIVIEPAPGTAAPADELIIDRGTAPVTGVAAAPAEEGGVEIRLDDAWAEYGHFMDSNSESDDALYGKLGALANWQPSARWEVQVSGRIDGYSEDGDDSFSTVDADYGDSFIRYRGDTFRLTAGAQTVIWGRLDEIPLSDRVSTADLRRFILDDLADRRVANPSVRAEAFVGGGKLDLVWLYDFRGAELPDKDSVWYPINTRSGRILGIDPADIAPAAVRNAVIEEDEPDGDGGFGARYTRTHSFADVGVTLARTRQSTPYYRAAGIGRFVTEYPRSWISGIDAAIDAAGATWRLELVYSSDNPVTRRDLSYTTTPGINWGGGVEFHPGDGDTRVNLQLVGMRLLDPPTVIDRTEIYSFNGEIEVPFDRDRWRATLDFYAGLDERDVYLNPRLTFLGWEPHEVYVAMHYFAGEDNTIGGFHEDHSMINVGWRTDF